MPKRKGPVLDNPTARDILNELSLYAKDRQFYPVQNALWRYMAQTQYNPKTHKKEEARYPKLGVWTFDYWFDRLIEEGYIEVDNITRAIRCVHLEIVEREGSDIP